MNDAPDGEGYAVYAYELVPGALEADLPAWLVGELAAQATVILVRDGRCEVLTRDPSFSADALGAGF
jgi:hypothetical protein